MKTPDKLNLQIDEEKPMFHMSHEHEKGDSISIEEAKEHTNVTVNK